MVDGSNLPITLWCVLYPADFLQKLLGNDNTSNFKNLVNVELYYRDKENWVKSLENKDIKGKVGYINMQFAGLEMQNNPNWQTLINYPNTPVR